MSKILLKHKVVRIFLIPGTDPASAGMGSAQVTLKAANISNGAYVYRNDLHTLDSFRGRLSAARWPVFSSPFRLENWSPAFLSHPDKQFVAYIRTGLLEGFRIGFNREVTSLHSRAHNHPSAAANPALVSESIAAEVAKGRLVGPIPEHLVPLVKISPLGLIPKPHQVNRWRMIVDLSYPRNHSINAGISEELASVTYAHVDDAVRCIQALGAGTRLIKTDLDSAYRQIPVHPDDHHLLGISWNGHTTPFWVALGPQNFFSSGRHDGMGPLHSWYQRPPSLSR